MSSNRDPRTFAIIGAAMEVHRQLGGGFLEAVYQEAMAIELESRGIFHGRKVELPVFYKGRRLACEYRADFVCFESVIVELKAVSELSGAHQAQVINYLKATGSKSVCSSTSAVNLWISNASSGRPLRNLRNLRKRKRIRRLRRFRRWRTHEDEARSRLAAAR